MRFRIGLGDETARSEIYRLRHRVYATELHQHPVNDEGQLHDDLDEHNIYITLHDSVTLCGFISITSPDAPKYSVDKYIDRCNLPFLIDRKVFEVRLLTVVPEYRQSPAAFLLMHETLRWVERMGGKRIVAIGRREVLSLYEKCGFERLGNEFTSGAVTFELMTATIPALKIRADELSTLVQRFERTIDREPVGLIGGEIHCYHGGAFYGAIGERFDALDKKDRVLKADVLDAWFPPSPKVLAAIEDHLPWLLGSSPPTNASGMEEVIAECRGVPRDCVLAGGGSSDLIYLALGHWLNPASKVLILDPMYGEYRHLIEHVVGATVTKLHVSVASGFALTRSVLEVVLAEQFDHVILVNPNSPTGQYFDSVELARIIAQAPQSTRFWIDETYIEYVGREHSLERFASSRPNITICKSMSKVYGLSGARAAYLVASKERIDELRRFSPPWSVSHIGQVAAVNALLDAEYYDGRYAETHILRNELSQALQHLGWKVFPSVANFLLCELPMSYGSAHDVATRCAKQNMFIREVSNMGDFPNDRFIRLTVLDQEQNKKMLSILRSLPH